MITKFTRITLKNFREALILGIIIVILSFMSTDKMEEISQEIQFADKIAHFLMYFGFTFFLLKGFIRSFNDPKLKTVHITYTLIIAFFFGGIIEIFQLTITSDRSGELLDMMCNILGAVLIPIFYNTLNKLYTQFVTKIQTMFSK